MDKIIHDCAKEIRRAFGKIPLPTGNGRPSTIEIYKALKNIRLLILKKYGGPIFSRHSGGQNESTSIYALNGRTFRTLEYLWDFSLSRYAIPQAIEVSNAEPINEGKYELLMVAESELGTKDEICRDLLKLLEARTAIRCLVYRQPKRLAERRNFESRMLRVLHNHAYFEQSPGLWLLIGITWSAQKMEYEVYTLNDQLDAIVKVNET